MKRARLCGRDARAHMGGGGPPKMALLAAYDDGGTPALQSSLALASLPLGWYRDARAPKTPPITAPNPSRRRAFVARRRPLRERRLVVLSERVLLQEGALEPPDGDGGERGYRQPGSRAHL